MLDAITESGTVYRIDTEEGFWKRFPQGENSPFVTTERIWSLKAGDKLCFPWQDGSAWVDSQLPVVGKHLFIASRDIWYTSQRIVKLVENVSWDAPPSKM